MRFFPGQIFFCSAARFDTLLKWPSEITHSGIKVGHGSFGLGMIATEPIEKDTVILKIKNENLITLQRAFEVRIRLWGLRQIFEKVFLTLH